MTTNSNFHPLGLAATQEVYEDLIIQAIQIYGMDMTYITREVVKEDAIFGEDIASVFDDGYTVEFYVENTDGFEGQDLFQKFGVEIRDDATFVVSKKRWESVVITDGGRSELIRPREGDLVYAPFANAVFEVNEVVFESPFYQLGQLPVYKLECSLFKHSGEDIDIVGIDESEFSGTMELDLDSSVAFTVGETLSQTVGAATVTGEVTKVTGDKVEVINVSNNTDDFVVFGAGAVSGGTSGLSGTVATATYLNDYYGDNDEIETIVDDFTEFNVDAPFGDF